MGLVRSAVRRVTERVARVVARDDLFEKPGERAPTAPLTPPEPVETPAPSDDPVVSVDAAASVDGRCQPVDVNEVVGMLRGSA